MFERLSSLINLNGVLCFMSPIGSSGTGIIKALLEWFCLPKWSQNYYLLLFSHGCKLILLPLIRHLEPFASFFHWEQPPERWFKLNVEGCRKGFLGTLRNSFGAWHVGFCVNLERGEILNAVFWQIFLGLQIAWNKEVDDSVIVVQLILHGATDIILLVNWFIVVRYYIVTRNVRFNISIVRWILLVMG